MIWRVIFNRDLAIWVTFHQVFGPSDWAYYFHLFLLSCLWDRYWIGSYLMLLIFISIFRALFVADWLLWFHRSLNIFIRFCYWLRFIGFWVMLGDVIIGLWLFMCCSLSSCLPLYFCRRLWIWALGLWGFCDDLWWWCGLSLMTHGYLDAFGY